MPPLPKAGTLVKGRRDDVFLVDERGLRWISSLDVFMRHGFSWPSVQQVDDLALAHWPVDLPLDDAPD